MLILLVYLSLNKGYAYKKNVFKSKKVFINSICQGLTRKPRGEELDLKTTVRAAQNLAFKIKPLQFSTKW